MMQNFWEGPERSKMSEDTRNEANQTIIIVEGCRNDFKTIVEVLLGVYIGPTGWNKDMH